MESPLSALFLWKGPALVPVAGTGQGNIPLDVELPTVGCWCWYCSWHHRRNSPKGIACLEVSPWLSVTRPCDVSHSPPPPPRLCPDANTASLYLQVVSGHLFIHFLSIPLSLWVPPSPWRGSSWSCRRQSVNKWGWLFIGASCYSLCINSADQPRALSACNFQSRHIWKVQFFC